MPVNAWATARAGPAGTLPGGCSLPPPQKSCCQQIPFPLGSSAIPGGASTSGTCGLARQLARARTPTLLLVALHLCNFRSSFSCTTFSSSHCDPAKEVGQRPVKGALRRSPPRWEQGPDPLPAPRFPPAPCVSVPCLPPSQPPGFLVTWGAGCSGGRELGGRRGAGELCAAGLRASVCPRRGAGEAGPTISRAGPWPGRTASGGGGVLWRNSAC